LAWELKMQDDSLHRALSRPLKNGDWLGATCKILGEISCRDVPVPLFQHIAVDVTDVR
jgi:hypothetical protein